MSLPNTNTLLSIRRRYETDLEMVDSAITENQKKNLDWKARSDLIDNIIQFRMPLQATKTPEAYGDEKLDAVEAERRKYWFKGDRQKITPMETPANDNHGGVGFLDSLGFNPKKMWESIKRIFSKLGPRAAMASRGGIYGLAAWGAYEAAVAAGIVNEDEIIDTISKIDFTGVSDANDAIAKVMDSIGSLWSSDDVASAGTETPVETPSDGYTTSIESAEANTSVAAPLVVTRGNDKDTLHSSDSTTTSVSYPTVVTHGNDTQQPLSSTTPPIGVTNPEAPLLPANAYKEVTPGKEYPQPKDTYTKGPLKGIPVNTAFTGDPRYAPLADLIGHSEGGKFGYNALVYKLDENKKSSSGGSADLINMTIGEVKEFQKGMIAEGHASTAVGRYQIIHSTLKGAQAGLGLPDSAKFDQRTQDKMFMYLADGRGFKKYLDNPTEENKKKLLSNLPNEWAILKTASGKGAFDGIVGNKGSVGQNTVNSAISRGSFTPVPYMNNVTPGNSGTPDRSQPGDQSYYATPNDSGGYSGTVIRDGHRPSNPARKVMPTQTTQPSQPSQPMSKPSASISKPNNPRMTNPTLQKAFSGDVAMYV